jgi:hypothetical protein
MRKAKEAWNLIRGNDEIGKNLIFNHSAMV